MSEKNPVAGCIGICVVALGIIIIAAVMHGVALSVLWGWFITPTFDVPALTLVQAIGVSLVVGAFVGSKTMDKSNTDKDRGVWGSLAYALMLAIVPPLMSMGWGWVIVQFM